MAEFVPNIGYDNCPKCGGWQVLDKTNRSANGWPIGDLVYVDCDHCKGRGEVPKAGSWPTAPEPSWQAIAPRGRSKAKPSLPVEIDDVPIPACEHEQTITTNDNGVIMEKCAACDETISIEETLDLTEEPKPASGWAMFNKEPG